MGSGIAFSNLTGKAGGLHKIIMEYGPADLIF
jgi:hypothetical protein